MALRIHPRAPRDVGLRPCTTARGVHAPEGMTKPYYNLLVRRVIGGVQIGHWIHTENVEDRAMAEARYNAIVAAGGHDVRLDRIALDQTPIGSTVADHCAPRLGDPDFAEYAPRFSLEVRPTDGGRGGAVSVSRRWGVSGPTHNAIPHDQIDRWLADGGHDVRVVRLEPIVLYRAARPPAAERTPAAAGRELRRGAVLCALRLGPRHADQIREAIGDLFVRVTIELLREMAVAYEIEASRHMLGAWELLPYGRACFGCEHRAGASDQQKET